MDLSRAIKRLILIIAISLFVIYVSKSLLSRTVKNLGIEAQKKQGNVIKKQTTSAGLDKILPVSSSPANTEGIETPAGSSPLDTAK